MTTPKLTDRGRATLEARLRRLREERIPSLEGDAAGSDDAVVDAALRSARAEAERLTGTLAAAGRLEEEPHDPSVVELGDSVTVHFDDEDGEHTYTIVTPTESAGAVDDDLISEDSPLGSALMGGVVDATVEVLAPAGARTCAIVRIERHA